MYEMSATIYDLDNRANTLLKDKEQEIEDLDEEWRLKYEETYDEMDQRLILSEKEKRYLADKL